MYCMQKLQEQISVYCAYLVKLPLLLTPLTYIHVDHAAIGCFGLNMLIHECIAVPYLISILIFPSQND